MLACVYCLLSSLRTPTTYTHWAVLYTSKIHRTHCFGVYTAIRNCTQPPEIVHSRQSQIPACAQPSQIVHSRQSQIPVCTQPHSRRCVPILGVHITLVCTHPVCTHYPFWCTHSPRVSRGRRVSRGCRLIRSRGSVLHHVGWWLTASSRTPWSRPKTNQNQLLKEHCRMRRRKS